MKSWTLWSRQPLLGEVLSLTSINLWLERREREPCPPLLQRRLRSPGRTSCTNNWRSVCLLTHTSISKLHSDIFFSVLESYRGCHSCLDWTKMKCGHHNFLFREIIFFLKWQCSLNFFNLFYFFVSVTVSLCKLNLINTFVLIFLILSVKSLVKQDTRGTLRGWDFKNDCTKFVRSVFLHSGFLDLVRQNCFFSVLTQLVNHQNTQFNVETKKQGLHIKDRTFKTILDIQFCQISWPSCQWKRLTTTTHMVSHQSK